jgi:hypothetical protein
MYKQNWVLFFLLVSFPSVALFGQLNHDNSTELEFSTWYKTRIPVSLELSYGENYKMKWYDETSHPFLLQKYPVIGSLNYRGKRFDDIEMLYDVFRDQLIISHPDRKKYPGQFIRLYKDQLTSFQLHESKFVNVVLDGASRYMKMVYQGRQISLLMTKSKIEVQNNAKNSVEFRGKNSYYIFYGGVYSMVKNWKVMTKYFPSLKGELRELAKESRSVKSKEQLLINMVTLCDHKTTLN